MGLKHRIELCFPGEAVAGVLPLSGATLDAQGALPTVEPITQENLSSQAVSCIQRLARQPEAWAAWRDTRVGRIALGVATPLLLLWLWSHASAQGWIAPQILPAPSLVWETLVMLWQSGDLLFHAWTSLQRVFWGFLAGGGIGLVLGVAIGLSGRVREYVDPIFVALAQVPPIGWIPLVMLLAGIDEALKIIVIAKAAMVPVVINTYMGIHAVPERFREVGKVLMFSPWDTLSRIVLPAAWPSIFTGVRYGLSNAWMALVAVELLASYEGLGYLIVWGRQMFELELVLASMIIIGAIGFTMDWLLSRVELRLQRWKEAG